MTTLSQDCLINDNNSFFLFENPPTGTDTLNGSLNMTGNLSVVGSISSGAISASGNIQTSGTLNADGGLTTGGTATAATVTTNDLNVNGNITVPVYSNTIPQPLSGVNNFILGFGILIPDVDPELPPLCEVLYSGASLGDYIFLSHAGVALAVGEYGTLSAGAIFPGTGFTVTSSSAADVGSLFNYLIIKGSISAPPPPNVVTYNFNTGLGLPAVFAPASPNFVFNFISTLVLPAGTIINIDYTGTPGTITTSSFSPSIPGSTIIISGQLFIITLGSPSASFSVSVNATEPVNSLDKCLVEYPSRLIYDYDTNLPVLPADFDSPSTTFQITYLTGSPITAGTTVAILLIGVITTTLSSYTFTPAVPGASVVITGGNTILITFNTEVIPAVISGLGFSAVFKVADAVSGVTSITTVPVVPPV